MEKSEQLIQARRWLVQAKSILDVPGRYDPAEWMLLATLVGDADLIIRGDRQAEPELYAVLGQVVKELREDTLNFTSPDFMFATRAARRRNPGLFEGSA